MIRPVHDLARLWRFVGVAWLALAVFTVAVWWMRPAREYSGGIGSVSFGISDGAVEAFLLVIVVFWARWLLAVRRRSAALRAASRRPPESDD